MASDSGFDMLPPLIGCGLLIVCLLILAAFGLGRLL
jgi:hypothetical protein